MDFFPRGGSVRLCQHSMRMAFVRSDAAMSSRNVLAFFLKGGTTSITTF